MLSANSAKCVSTGPQLHCRFRGERLSAASPGNGVPCNPDEDQRVAKTIGCAMALTKAAERMEATSAQAVKRGHQVTMIEVPDEDDDISFQRWLATGSPTISLKPRATTLLTPPESPLTSQKPLPNEGVVLTCIAKNEVTSLMVATPSMASVKVQEAPHRWMRPFEVNWMLCAVCEAQNNNAACATLAVWIHCDKAAKMTDELLTELQFGGESA